MIRKGACLLADEMEAMEKEAAKGTPAPGTFKSLTRGRKLLGGAGIVGGLVASGLLGRHLANQDEPEIASSAFDQGFDIGQEEAAHAIYNALQEAPVA